MKKKVDFEELYSLLGENPLMHLDYFSEKTSHHKYTIRRFFNKLYAQGDNVARFWKSNALERTGWGNRNDSGSNPRNYRNSAEIILYFLQQLENPYPANYYQAIQEKIYVLDQAMAVEILRKFRSGRIPSRKREYGRGNSVSNAKRVALKILKNAERNGIKLTAKQFDDYLKFSDNQRRTPNSLLFEEWRNSVSKTSLDSE